MIAVDHGGRDGAGASNQSVVVSRAAISTSGSTAQFVEIDGRRFSHIIDPRTGLGIAPGTAATVIAARGEDADALATAICVMGRARAEAMLATLPSVAAIVNWGDDEQIYRRERIELRGAAAPDER